MCIISEVPGWYCGVMAQKASTGSGSAPDAVYQTESDKSLTAFFSHVFVFPLFFSMNTLNHEFGTQAELFMVY